MANTIREQIIQAVLTRLATMRTSGGYNYDCGGNVFRAIKILDEDDFPAVILWPETEECVNEYGVNSITTKFRVEAVSEFTPGTHNPSIVNEALLGDIIKCVTGGSTAISSLIDEIAYVAGGPADIPSENHTVTAAYAEFEIKYSTSLGDPYQAG